MIREKDVAIVIPTYNRPDDVDRTLDQMVKNKNIPGKVFVVDQSKDSRTKDVVKKFTKKLPVKYIHLDKPSSSMAENRGVEEGIKTCSLILIIGDDIDLLPGYLKTLVAEFNDHPEVMGVGGADIPRQYNFNSPKHIIANFLLGLFLLPHKRKNKFLITSPYGNTESPVVTRDVRDAQWIPGFNNCFRREIYQTYRFPKIKGYNLQEDIDCSYKVYRKFGEGSLVITPRLKVVHRWSQTERYPPKKRIFATHEDHFAFYYRNFYTFSGTCKLIWNLIGLILGNLARAIVYPGKKSFNNLKYVVQAISFSYKNRENIKKGKYRIFLNDDLTMREDL